MRTRRAPTSQTQTWVDPLNLVAEPEPSASPRLDLLVEALGQAIARRQDWSRPAGDS